MSSWGEDSHTTKYFVILREDLSAASQVAHSLHRWPSACVCLYHKPLKLPQYLPLVGHLSPHVTSVLTPHLKPFLPFGILVGITKFIHTPPAPGHWQRLSCHVMSPRDAILEHASFLDHPP